MLQFKKILLLIVVLISTCISSQLFAKNNTSYKLQSALFIENNLDKALENEFCIKSNINKRKTIDYWSQKAGFLPHKLPASNNFFPEAEHRLFFDAEKEIISEASYKLGIFYGNTQCGTPDIEKAKYYLKKASKKPEARFAYAMILLRNKGKVSDIYRLFNESGNLGIGNGHYNAAIMLYRKDKVKYAKNIISLLSKATKNGHARADNDLGVFMLSEQGVKHILKTEDQYNKNIVQQYIEHAKSKIKKSAQKNDKYALYNTAILSSKGQCDNSEMVRKSLETSIKMNFQPAKKLYQYFIKKKCFETNPPERTSIELASALFQSEVNALQNMEKLGFLRSPK